MNRPFSFSTIPYPDSFESDDETVWRLSPVIAAMSVMLWRCANAPRTSIEELVNSFSTGSRGYSLIMSSNERAWSVFERLTSTFFPSLCFSASPSATSEDTAVDIVEWSNPSRPARSDIDAGFFSSLNIARLVVFGTLDKYDKMMYKYCWDFWTKSFILSD